MNLVGELVLARNQIVQFSAQMEEPGMTAASQRLNHITTELQEGVMKTRMQPIRNAWNKLPRVVRDLSAQCHKKVEVRMEGAETELDKTILEAIKDPLTHIVRNSVDHGIETPEVREANGKPATGTLLLRAYHEGGQVNIEIVDDGGGINSDRIRDKALEKGLVSKDQIDTMTEGDLINLILLPGFSTAAKVTNVSGRGVGMDVVKTNIEKIGGTLEIQSQRGHGTTLRIKIPLTLAIVPALIIASGIDNFAIPQINLLELVRLSGDRAAQEVEYIHDAPVYRLRGNLLPLVYLDEILELREPRERQYQPEAVNIVVLQAEDRQFGLVVDAVNDTQEIVVKPLGKHFNMLSTYAGATIMGDGNVALILDIIGIAKKAKALTNNREAGLGEMVSVDDEDNSNEPLLIVETGNNSRAAIKLATVARLEEFDVGKIERTQSGDVVQYRGDILPLHYLGSSSPAEGGTVDTVVVVIDGKSVGVVVNKIIDICRESMPTGDGPDARQCIIQGVVTELVDINSQLGFGLH